MKSNYFDLKELVCPDVYRRFGEWAWIFLDEKRLDTLAVLREKIFDRPMLVNTWAAGGAFTQRGLRCNLCPLVREKSAAGVPYLSAHNLGKAVDFDVPGLSAETVRETIVKNQILLPHPIRLEKGTSWVHLDVYDEGKGRICFFAG